MNKKDYSYKSDWDKIYSTYTFEQLPWIDAELNPRIIDFIKSLPGGLQILDVGCGDGRLSECLSFINGNDITAIDISAEIISLCSKRKGNVNYQVRDAFHLDKSETFDVVICGFLIHHILEKDINLLLDIIAGITKFNGYLLLTYLSPQLAKNQRRKSLFTAEHDVILYDFNYLRELLPQFELIDKTRHRLNKEDMSFEYELLILKKR